MFSLSNGGGGTLRESMMGFISDSPEYSSDSSHLISSESHLIFILK